jgi:hypothetical protein
MWELRVQYAHSQRTGDTFSFDDKPRVDEKGPKVLVHSGTMEGREQEVWLYIDNVAAWWLLGPRQQ